VSKDLVALGIILLVALPPILFNVFMRVVKRKPFRAIIPYMVVYVFVITALPGWYIGLWWWLLALLVSVSVIGTWLFLSGWADLTDAAQASRDRQRKM
jgi:UPF0716 family protein affecting phage T7 exclusion